MVSPGVESAEVKGENIGNAVAFEGVFRGDVSLPVDSGKVDFSACAEGVVDDVEAGRPDPVRAAAADVVEDDGAGEACGGGAFVDGARAGVEFAVDGAFFVLDREQQGGPAEESVSEDAGGGVCVAEVEDAYGVGGAVHPAVADDAVAAHLEAGEKRSLRGERFRGVDGDAVAYERSVGEHLAEAGQFAVREEVVEDVPLEGVDVDNYHRAGSGHVSVVRTGFFSAGSGFAGDILADVSIHIEHIEVPGRAFELWARNEFGGGRLFAVARASGAHGIEFHWRSPSKAH